MDSKLKIFRELHALDEPLLLGNVWDVPSAQSLQKLNFKAIGTSSAAIAATLGYNDGEEMPFDEYFFIIQRIAAKSIIPLSVDLEAGYGTSPSQVVSNITKLYDMGVTGVNIEDSRVLNGSRELQNASEVADCLGEVVARLKEVRKEVFINVRTDTYLLNIPSTLEETHKRLRLYEQAGANGLFVPCITDISDIKSVVNETSVPLNVMCMPNLPNFETLKRAGVKRISFGNFAHSSMQQLLEEKMRVIVEAASFNSLF